MRGISNANYKLETSLIRLGGPYRKLERHLLDNFKRYGGSETANLKSIWELLIVAQHHGLPTRILDWTYSPYVALHFATVNTNNYNSDGAIWCVDFLKVQNYLPVNIKNELKNNKAFVFSSDLLSKIFPENLEPLKALENTSQPEDDFCLFMEPPSLNERIINQFALCSFMSDPDIAMDDWLLKHKDDTFWKKIIIDKNLKGEIRDKLDQSNINERILFPGLDGISKWLSRHFSPRKSFKI